MGNLPALSVSTICFKVYSLLQCVVLTTWADWWRLHNLKQTQCCPTWHNFMMIIFSSRLQSWHVIGSTYWPKFPGGLEMVKQGNRDSLLHLSVKYFLHPCLVIYLFQTPPIKQNSTANRWETTNSKSPAPTIIIGQSETGSSSQIIFITLVSGRCCWRLCCNFYQPQQTLQKC